MDDVFEYKWLSDRNRLYQWLEEVNADWLGETYATSIFSELSRTGKDRYEDKLLSVKLSYNEDGRKEYSFYRKV